MPFWRKSEKSDARRDAKAHFLLVKGNTEKSSFTKKCWGEKKSVFRHHWPFYPIRLRDFYIFSTEFSSYTRHGGVIRGWLWAPMQVLWKMLQTREIRTSTSSWAWGVRKSSLAKSRHTLGIKSCMSWDAFATLLDRFWPAQAPFMTKLLFI